jgi:hypothetical protein
MTKFISTWSIRIVLVIKMIGWFFIEIFELITGKRKFWNESDADDDSDDDHEESER